MMAPEFAGPDEQPQIPEVVRTLARRCGDHRPVFRVGKPGKIGKAMAVGALLPHRPGPRGKITFGDWLELKDIDS